MTYEEQFWDALESNADDEFARLAFADWLEERGDVRAAWIRDPLVCRWVRRDQPDPVPALLAAIDAEEAAGDDSSDSRTALAAVGTTAVPPLLEILRTADWNQRDLFGSVLGIMDAAALRPFVSELIDLIPTAGREIVGAFSNLGPDAGPAVPALLAAEADGRIDAVELARALSRVGPAAAPAAERLRGILLGVVDRGFIYQAVEFAAAAFARIDADNVTEILRLAHGMTPEGVEFAAEGLSNLGPDIAPQLSNIPGDVDLAGRCLAAFALSHVTPGAAVGPILDVLDDAAPALQLAAARALARIGPAAAAAAPALRRLLNAGDEELAENAAHALAAVAGQVGLAELTERLNDPAPAMRELAIAPLAEMAREHQSVRGPLLAALGDPSPRVRLAVASTLRTFLNRGDVDAVHPLREALTDSEEYVRSQAANCLGRLRSAASPSVPDLIRATRDPAASVRRAAVAALDGMQYESPEMLVALVAALDDPDQSVCHAAATGLAAWSRLFPDSAAAIFARARHPDRVVRRGAILLLGKSAQADPELIAFLRETLQNEPDDELRVAAADSLGRLGAVSPDLTTHLVALLDATGRAEVAGALASLGDPPALEALDERLRNNPQMRPALVGALKQSAAHSTFTSLVDGLTACLSDSNPPVREQAAQLLGDLGGAAASAIDALRQCTADADGPVREAALVALANASPDPATVFADLARGVTDPDLVARQMAVLKLNELPLPDSDKLSLLRPALQDENRSVRQAAASGLQALGPAAAPATTDLLLLLHDEFHEVRADAAAALGAIGPAAGDVVPALRRLLSDAEPFVRSSAAFALCSFGPAAADAEPELVRIIMEDQAANVRSAAAEALHSIGRTSSAAGAVVMLRRKLLDPDGEERGYAAATLGGLGPIAVAAVPELLAALRDPAWGDIREQYRRRQLQLGFRVFSDEQLDELAYDRRIHVAEALGRIGLADHAVIAALREAADDGDQLVSRYAVVALGRLQPASESALRELLDHVNDVIRVDAARELQAAPPSAENVSETDNAS